MKKAAVKFEVEPGREGHITGFEAAACRDRFCKKIYNNYVDDCVS